MKESLNHWPERKIGESARITAIIRCMAQAEAGNWNQKGRSGMKSERANTFFYRHFVFSILVICFVVSLARTGYGDGKYLLVPVFYL